MKNKKPEKQNRCFEFLANTYKKNAFTLLELLIVIVILGILGTVSIAQYLAARERALDREAEANLRLILAAERTYRMEDSNNQYIQVDTTAAVNSTLKLLLPQGANRAWDYFVHVRTVTLTNDDFCAQATRNDAGARPWSINAPTGGTPDPQPQRDVACTY